MLFVCRLVPICFCLVLLVFCSACSQWRFAKPGQRNRLSTQTLSTQVNGPDPASPMTQPPVAPAQNSAPPVQPVGRSTPVGTQSNRVCLAPTQQPYPPRSAFPSQVGSPQIGMQPLPPTWQHAPTQPYFATKPQFEPQPNLRPAPAVGPVDNPLREVTPQRRFGEFISPGAAFDTTTSSTVSTAAPPASLPRPVTNPAVNQVVGPMVSPTIGAGLDQAGMDGYMPYDKRGSFFRPRSRWHDICQDHYNYYTWPNACGYLYAIAGGSLLANTSLDDDFRDWYQRDARNKETDNFAAFWKTFGEGEYVVPLFACTAVVGKALDRFPIADTIGEHGYRTTRAYLVGFPPMLFSQHLLGGSRPNEAPHESMWRPFNDNNAVSGHSFMGAVPFITAAQMSDCWFTKAGLYTLSTFPAWSRVNDDAHFLSQVCLGWYMAYMACNSVNKTSGPCRNFEFFPLCHPSGGAGIMAIWKR